MEPSSRSYRSKSFSLARRGTNGGSSATRHDTGKTTKRTVEWEHVGGLARCLWAGKGENLVPNQDCCRCTPPVKPTMTVPPGHPQVLPSHQEREEKKKASSYRGPPPAFAVGPTARRKPPPKTTASLPARGRGQLAICLCAAHPDR